MPCESVKTNPCFRSGLRFTSQGWTSKTAVYPRCSEKQFSRCGSSSLGSDNSNTHSGRTRAERAEILTTIEEGDLNFEIIPGRYKRMRACRSTQGTRHPLALASSERQAGRRGKALCRHQSPPLTSPGSVVRWCYVNIEVFDNLRPILRCESPRAKLRLERERDPSSKLQQDGLTDIGKASKLRHIPAELPKGVSSHSRSITKLIPRK